MAFPKLRLPLLPRRLRTGLRWCRNGAACLALLYLAVGFVVLNLSVGPAEVQSASLFAGAVESGEGVRPVEEAAVEPIPGYTVLRGALSVHTGRSHDAEGTLEEVAAAARRTDLDFVVLGDHPGDWVDDPAVSMAPHHREGVLVVPGLELVVSGIGRTLAVGLDTLPRRWEGSVESLVQRADSLDGFLSVVHPRSPRSRERWDGLDAPGIHAWESFDVSEMARMRLKEPWAGYHLASFLGGLLVGRGEGSLAALWKERTTTPALLSYDSARVAQPMALTGGLNHHPKARLGWLLFPRYEPFFRTVVNHLLIPGEPATDPVEARDQVLETLRAGRLYVTLGDPERAAGFAFRGVAAGGERVEMGGGAPLGEGAALVLRSPPAAPGPLLVRVLRDGVEEGWVQTEAGQEFVWPVTAPGAYRVEVFRGGVRLGSARAGFRPWILSNPVEFYRGDQDRMALHP